MDVYDPLLPLTPPRQSYPTSAMLSASDHLTHFKISTAQALGAIDPQAVLLER